MVPYGSFPQMSWASGPVVVATQGREAVDAQATSSVVVARFLKSPSLITSAMNK